MFYSVIRYTRFCSRAWAKGTLVEPCQVDRLLDEDKTLFYVGGDQFLSITREKTRTGEIYYRFTFASMRYGDYATIHYASLEDVGDNLPFDFSRFKFLPTQDLARMADTEHHQLSVKK